MKFFINAIVSGLITGSLYGAMALGLTIVGGVVRIITFAHGSIAVMGGYFSWYLLKQLGVPLIPALLGASGIMFLFGLGLYYSSINPLLKKPGSGMSTLMFTLGLSILINNLLLQAFGPRIKHIPRFFKGVFQIGYLRISWHDIGLIIIIAVFFIAFMLLLKYTWFGRAVRAVSEDMDGAQIVGIDVQRTYGFTFGVGMAVAGFSGSLLATKLFISPTTEAEWMMKAFVIIILGGWGSVPGAFLAALVLGLAEAFTIMYLDTIWVQPIWAAIFLVVLLVRPQGLLRGRSVDNIME